MMNDIAKMQELWQEMSSWMTTYMKSFYSPEAAKTAKSHLEIKSAKTIFFDDAQIVDGIILKEKHTWMVVKNCENLAKHLNLNEHDSLLAKMIGLFHDVGRFYQFTVYRTFNDALSENHGTLLPLGQCIGFQPTTEKSGPARHGCQGAREDRRRRQGTRGIHQRVLVGTSRFEVHPQCGLPA